jgi:hypothetical protein
MDLTQLPPVVYAPTLGADDGTTRIRMQRMVDGQIALFVYSAMDRLAAQYGEDSPWVLLRVPDLEAAYQDSPFDLLFLDRALHPQEAAR